MTSAPRPFRRRSNPRRSPVVARVTGASPSYVGLLPSPFKAGTRKRAPVNPREDLHERILARFPGSSKAEVIKGWLVSPLKVRIIPAAGRVDAVAPPVPRLASLPRLRPGPHPAVCLNWSGAPDRIRTCDLCLRRAALYPAELTGALGGPKAHHRASRAAPAMAWAGLPPHPNPLLPREERGRGRRRLCSPSAAPGP